VRWRTQIDDDPSSRRNGHQKRRADTSEARAAAHRATTVPNDHLETPGQ
jgi:hypothetical protein